MTLKPIIVLFLKLIVQSNVNYQVAVHVCFLYQIYMYICTVCI